VGIEGDDVTKEDAMKETTHPTAPASTLLTFLVADIRGYTSYSAERGDRAAARLSERFLSLCHDVIAAHSGEVFGSAGDQALAAFSSAHAALYASVALQARLSDEQAAHPELPVAAGIGLDTGEGVRIVSDYRGNAINLAARLCSLAAGGEIFVSETVIRVANIVEGLEVVDRGEVKLKGLSAPVRVMQIARAGTLPPELPPLQPHRHTQPTNLPNDPTPFIGRAREIEWVAGLLRDSTIRLVTLTGPGGTGKTRLALQVGNSLLPSFRDGAFLCDLSALTEWSLVPSTLASVLTVGEKGGEDLMESLAHHLGEKHLLLLLDNFEHLLDAGTLVASLLDRCPELHVLVTSRVPLHLSREHEYPVPPLSVPDPAHLPEVTLLSQYEAVALFIERAAAVEPGFEVTNENAPAVAEICARLDGLPLAIELAAARTKLLPPKALLEWLSHSLTLLTGGARDRPTRQQTLRNTIDWSFSLLAADEQTLFARLSVFAGGCTLDMAEPVCNPEGEVDVLDGIAGLVDQSLLRREGEDVPRYSMLQTVREYAMEKLHQRGEEDQIRRAHARYFLALAEAGEPELTARSQGEWLSRLDAELDNVRQAIGWFLLQGDVEPELCLASALFEYWRRRGSWSEGRRWLEAGLQADHQAMPSVRAKAIWALGYFVNLQGDNEHARELLEEARDLFQALGDRRGSLRAASNLGMVALWQGQYERARAFAEEGRRLATDLGDESNIALATFALGTIAWYQGDLIGATERYQDALVHARAVGDDYTTSFTLTMWGQVALHEGRLAEAEHLCIEGLTVARGAAMERVAAWVLQHLGRIALGQGDLGRAVELAHESLRLAREQGDRALVLYNMHLVARLAVARGDALCAAQLKGAERALREGLGMPLPPVYQAEEIEVLNQARSVLDGEEFTRAWQAGQAMELEEAVGYSLRAPARLDRTIE
jgi:predicted ATPase/class 3 adenylate cyclase